MWSRVLSVSAFILLVSSAADVESKQQSIPAPALGGSSPLDATPANPVSCKMVQKPVPKATCPSKKAMYQVCSDGTESFVACS